MKDFDYKNPRHWNNLARNFRRSAAQYADNVTNRHSLFNVGICYAIHKLTKSMDVYHTGTEVGNLVRSQRPPNARVFYWPMSAEGNRARARACDRIATLVRKQSTPVTCKTIIGKQYSSRSNAERAIRKFQVRHFATIPKHWKFWVNRIDEGCHEILGNF